MTYPTFAVGEILTAADMNKVGLWKIGTFALGGTATQIDNVFTSDFDSYRIVFSNLTFSSADVVTLRLVDGVSPNVTSNYYSSRIGVGSTGTVLGAASAAVSFWNANIVGTNTAASGGSLDIYNPNLSVATAFQSVGLDARTGGDFWRASGGWFNGTTSFEGIWISNLNGSLTMAGNVSIYGYRK
jgi:hypothetical protein